MREMYGDTNSNGLRITRDREGLYFVGSGEGLTYRCYGAATGIKAAEKLRREVAKEPEYYGFDRAAALRCKSCGQIGRAGAYQFSTLPGSGRCDDCV